MKSIKLTIQYDGTEYAGWQVQPNEKTVQSVIEHSLRKIAPDSSSLLATGRTDAGVHALEQISCFKTTVKHSPDTIKKALNAQLPNDIVILEANYCEPSFHPRYDALKKIYSYMICADQNISPFLHRYVWNIHYRLDIPEMKKASSSLIGRHDFSSFQASGCAAKNPTREVMSISIKKKTTLPFMDYKIRGNFLTISVEANAFLRHMVRNIVGTLVEVGRGRIKAGELKKILASHDRTMSGPTAPPQGLFLHQVFY
ncbi:MAG: tRNA pseudouridine(38-40) synthase TruA [Thermodesulfovibrionales bacterium]